MKDILDIFKIPEQKKVGPFWGGVKDILGRAMFYIGILNFILIMITAYHTSIKDMIPVPFWIFLMALSIVFLIAMIFEYVIILPSSISFSNRQSYKHDNPIKEDMNRILNKLDNIEQQLKLSEQRLRLLEQQSMLHDKEIEDLYCDKIKEDD